MVPQWALPTAAKSYTTIELKTAARSDAATALAGFGLGATCSEIHYQRTEEETSRLAASTDENGKRGGGLERVRAARKSPGEMVAALPKTREAKPI